MAARTAVNSNQAKVNSFLNRHGLDASRVRVVEHETVESFLNSRSNKRRPALFERAFFRLLPGQFGFCKIASGEVHVARKAGIVVRVHETAHSADLTTNTALLRQIRSGMKAAASKPKGLKARVRLAAKDLEFDAVTEGRALLCEKAAGKDEKLSFWERMQFKMNRAMQKTSFASFAVMTVWGIVGLHAQHQLSQFSLACLAGVIVGIRGIYKRFHYVLGARFMERVEKFAGSVKEALKLTAEHPPTLAELFLPGKYLERIFRERAPKTTA